MTEKKIKVLLEMRPALEGFAGIPQEVRLLFRGLRKIEEVDIEGMIQHPHRILSRGTSPIDRYFNQLTPARKLNRYSRVIISLAELPYRNLLDQVLNYISKRISSSWLFTRMSLGFGTVKLTRFESPSFEDFVWRTMFSKTLPSSDFDLVTRGDFRICSIPWKSMHQAGLSSLNLKDDAKYPVLDTSGHDVFIAQTPYPGKVTKGTRMVIRYHDALPVFMPHTIPEKSIHQATHFHGLISNFRSGAYFACVSEATRQDLLKIIPEAKERSTVIHNMVSHNYSFCEVPFDRVQGIIRSRLNKDAEDLLPKFLMLREQESFYKSKLPSKPFNYLLIVSTIEPRKNHLRLLAAWEVLRTDTDSNLKLVIVGSLGWDNAPMIKAFKPWIDRGELFMLSAVPAPDLRILYRHACATVCPSLGEGFDFSGVESMASGGITVASDIPVHREVYDDAAAYFDPYSTMSLVGALRDVLYEPNSTQVQDKMRQRGQEVAARYHPEKILPQWDAFLRKVCAA